jgi:hypothetical protein
MGDPEIHMSSRQSETKTTSERTINIQVIFRKHLRPIIDRIPRAIENAAQHILRNRKLHGASSKLNVCCLDVHTSSSLKYLYNGFFPLNLKNLTTAFRAVRKRQLNDFIIGRELYWCTVGDTI